MPYMMTFDQAALFLDMHMITGVKRRRYLTTHHRPVSASEDATFTNGRPAGQIL